MLVVMIFFSCSSSMFDRLLSFNTLVLSNLELPSSYVFVLTFDSTGMDALSLEESILEKADWSLNLGLLQERQQFF